jgi:hypothetical protein
VGSFVAFSCATVGSFVAFSQASLGSFVAIPRALFGFVRRVIDSSLGSDALLLIDAWLRFAKVQRCPMPLTARDF